jgi:hypothetical protein
MSVNKFDSRVANTAEFMTGGLGGKLTRSAKLLLSASVEHAFGQWKQSAITYACGNIIERALWVGCGRWMGFFEDWPPISSDEQSLLREYAPQLNDARFPADFQRTRDLLVISGDHPNLSRYLFIERPLRRPARDWFPVFQAALIVSEMLTEGPITAFFLFLIDGNVENFQEQAPSPDKVMTALQDNHDVYSYFGERAWRESVIAGFIRYTEFLSAMVDIFPLVGTRPLADTPDIPSRVVDRDILYVNVRAFRWRIPDDKRALAAFQAVLEAFIKLTSQELSKYPAMGVQWSQEDTYLRVLRLSQHIFGVSESKGEYAEGQEDSDLVLERSARSVALESRLREVRGKGPRRVR